MEAIIRTENKTLFEALLQFLKSLNITIEAKEKIDRTAKYPKQLIFRKKTDEEIRAFYDSIRIDMSHYKFNRDRANER